MLCRGQRQNPTPANDTPPVSRIIFLRQEPCVHIVLITANPRGREKQTGPRHPPIPSVDFGRSVMKSLLSTRPSRVTRRRSPAIFFGIVWMLSFARGRAPDHQRGSLLQAMTRVTQPQSAKRISSKAWTGTSLLSCRLNTDLTLRILSRSPGQFLYRGRRVGRQRAGSYNRSSGSHSSPECNACARGEVSDWVLPCLA